MLSRNMQAGNINKTINKKQQYEKINICNVIIRLALDIMRSKHG